MQNLGRGQFSYEVLKVSYDADPRLQDIITNFDQDVIELKQSEMDDLPAQDASSDNTVSSMAKSATDIGAKL